LKMEIFDLLQKDFCPPLDSSLIAALLVDLESDGEGNIVSPSQDQIDNLYATCSALALHAEKSQQSESPETNILQTSQISVKSKKQPSTNVGEKKIQSPSNEIIIVLSDIRHQHNLRPSSSSSTRTTDRSNIKRSKAGATPDPWTRISSLSTHIASLLPPHPPSFFQSFFHSPIHTTSYDALRVALTSLCKNKQDEPNYTTIVSNIMDILSLKNGDVDPELKARRTADIRLSVIATDGRATEALDLVNVLRELDTKPDIGLSHLLPAQVSKSSGVNPSGSASQSNVMSKPPSPTSGNKPNSDQWHIVRSRTTPRVRMPTTSRPMHGM